METEDEKGEGIVGEDKKDYQKRMDPAAAGYQSIRTPREIL